MKKNKIYTVEFYATKHGIEPFTFKTESLEEACDAYYKIADMPDDEQKYAHGVFYEGNGEIISQWCNPVKAFSNLDALCNM